MDQGDGTFFLPPSRVWGRQLPGAGGRVAREQLHSNVSRTPPVNVYFPFNTLKSSVAANRVAK